MNMQQQEQQQQKQYQQVESNNFQNKNRLTQVMTTLHDYPMIGPYPIPTDDVWYCDNKKCQYTTYGVYRKYQMQNWRSSKFGVKYVICDGCMRQFVQNKIPEINVKINFPQNNQHSQHSTTQSLSKSNGNFYNKNNPPIVIPLSITSTVPLSSDIQIENDLKYTENDSKHKENESKHVEKSKYKEKSLVDKNTKDINNINKEIKAIEKKEIPFFQETLILKEGWMLKQCGSLIKSWKKRYFALKTDRQLYYYQTEDKHFVQGIAQFYKVNHIKKINQQIFEVATEDRTWSFTCKNEDDCNDWMACIAKLCKARVV